MDVEDRGNGSIQTLKREPSISRMLVRPGMDKESLMKKEIGLWIDHRVAIIVILAEGGEEIVHVISNNGKHIRYSGRSHSEIPEGLKEVTSEDRRDRKSGNDLNKYYDGNIAIIRD